MALYTSYLNNIEDIYPEMYVVLVMRYRPRCLKINGILRGNVAWYPTLSPNQQLLKKFKQDGDWDYYVKAFYEQYGNTQKMEELLHRLVIGSERRDICMICYCTDFIHCHTKLLADICMDKWGCHVSRI